MTWTGHVAVATLAQGHPIGRIFFAFMSHWILDTMVDEHRPKGLHLTDKTTWGAHKGWLALQIAGPLFLCMVTRNWWALFAVAPDCVEAGYAWYKLRYHGVNTWMSGAHLFSFHRPSAKIIHLSKYSNYIVELLCVAMAMLSIWW